MLSTVRLNNMRGLKSKFKKSNPKIHSRVGEGGGAEVGVGTWCTGPGSVLFNDWITSLSSRNITKSFNIQDTVLNSLKPEKKVFFLLKEWYIISNKSGSTFFYQFINYRAIPEFIFPNCLTGYEIDSSKDFFASCINFRCFLNLSFIGVKLSHSLSRNTLCLIWVFKNHTCNTLFIKVPVSINNEIRKVTLTRPHRHQLSTVLSLNSILTCWGRPQLRKATNTAEYILKKHIFSNIININ